MAFSSSCIGIRSLVVDLVPKRRRKYGIVKKGLSYVLTLWVESVSPVQVTQVYKPVKLNNLCAPLKYFWIVLFYNFESQNLGGVGLGRRLLRFNAKNGGTDFDKLWYTDGF